MTQPVQGPAYYFPSIEKKYGRPINEWIDLIRSDGTTGASKHRGGHSPMALSRSGDMRFITLQGRGWALAAR